MKRWIELSHVGIALALASCATTPVDRTPVNLGRGIAERQCSGCHAVALTGASPRPQAPPLRDLYKRYAIEDLRRAFLTGIHVGHPDMPTFQLKPRDVDSLLIYLRSLDPCAQPASDTAAVERCFEPL